METRVFKVEGLSCTDCAGRIQASVSRLDGVRECQVDYATGKLTLKVDVPDFDVTPVAHVVEATGHKLIVERRRAQTGSAAPTLFRFLLSRRETTMTTIAGLLAIVGLALGIAPVSPAVRITLFTLAIGIGSIPVLRHAYQEVGVGRTLGINTLMVIAVTGAMVIGEWPEAAIVVVLFSLGEALEGYAVERVRGALESLLDLAPPVALRMRPDGPPEELPVEQLVIGDRVLVRPGDRVSVDGMVRAGQSAVDQAAITGESIPVDKIVGDRVFAGAVNTFGALEVEVTRPAGDNTLSRMIALVQEAQARKAPVQRFVERFARVYTPAVTAIALLVASVPPLCFGQLFWGDDGWLMRALQMLVIACPCALVISTPVSVVSALTNAAAHGVLIKGGATLEALGRVKVFAFDKTGTLTEGRPVATDLLSVCTDTSHSHHGLQYAAAVEAQSSHPLAQALVAEAQAQKIAVLPAEEVHVLSGHGVTGLVNGARVTVASHPYFDTTIPHSEEICTAAERLAAAGKTVMLVCHDDQVCSIFAVADTPRPVSRQALADLHTSGIRTVMLTGDSPAVAQAIARQVGVDDVRAGLLPEDKVNAIREIQGSRITHRVSVLSIGGGSHIKNQEPRIGSRESGIATPVAFVGDGVNDAPALAQADVGIAMGGAGSAQAMETADVVLMGDDLRQLPFLVRLSGRTRQIVRVNIVLALVVKATVFALAAAGLATLWIAMAADVGASLVVILNGMRLRSSAT